MKITRQEVPPFAEEDSCNFDTEICCGAIRLSTHRLLLAASSNFLKTIIQATHEEMSDEPLTIILPDSNPQEVRHLLGMLHLGNKEESREHHQFDLFHQLKIGHFPFNTNDDIQPSLLVPKVEPLEHTLNSPGCWSTEDVKWEYEVDEWMNETVLRAKEEVVSALLTQIDEQASLLNWTQMPCHLCNKVSQSDCSHRKSKPGLLAYSCDTCDPCNECREQSTISSRDEVGQNSSPEDSSTGKSEVCQFCAKVLSNGCLASHMKRVHNKFRPFNCTVCPKKFASNDDLAAHTKRRHTDTPFQCETCSKTFKIKFNLIRHIRTHTGERPYKCDLCGKSFSQSDTLAAHKRTHTGKLPFKCDVCTKTFSLMSELDAHSAEHTGKKLPYECKHCCKQFALKRAWTDHIRIHERPFKCETCGKAFLYQSNLYEHLKIHSGDYAYLCQFCEKGFRSASNLEMHERIHRGIRPHKCDVCNKTFTTPQAVAKHMLIHTGEKPHTCSECGKSFSQSGHLKTHMRMHTGERPYVCSVCSKTFAIKGNLTAHERTHSGEKPFACSVCNDTFASSKTLKGHMKMHEEKAHSLMKF